MKAVQFIETRIMNAAQLQAQLLRWRLLSKTIAFTNGCFDIVHAGHIHSLSQAAGFADVLIVGLNSDASTRGLKGEGRPINKEQDRALLLASLVMVDAVVLFDESTPLELIKTIQPDVLVKGGDYTPDNIAGASWVLQQGGEVKVISLLDGYSTTNIESKLKG